MFSTHSRVTHTGDYLVKLSVCATVACSLVGSVQAQPPLAGGAATLPGLRKETAALVEDVELLQRDAQIYDPKINRSARDSEKLAREAERLAAECREYQKAANETAAGWKPINAQVQSAEQAAGDTRQGAASIRSSLDRVDQLAAQLSNRDQASEIVQRYDAAQASVKRGGERLAEARHLNSQAKDAFLADKQSAEAYAIAQRSIAARLDLLKSSADKLKTDIDNLVSYEERRRRSQQTADRLVSKLQQLQTSVRGKDAKAEKEIADALAEARAARNSNVPSLAALQSKSQTDLNAINKTVASVEADVTALRDQRAKQSKFADEAVAAAENAQSDAEIRLAASRPAYEKALEFLRRNPEAGLVPDVVTKTAAEACQLVVQAKLNPGTEFVRTGIPAGREGTVFEQSLPAGTRVPEGTNVILKIYGAVVPSLLGWRVPTAGDIVGEVGLSLDKVTLDRTAPSEQQAERIYWQDPPAGSPIRPDRKLVDVRAYAQWKTSSTTPPATVQVGFQPGDGALIDPRFAAAQVTDGLHPEMKATGIDHKSAGPNSELKSRDKRPEGQYYDWTMLYIRRFTTPEEVGTAVVAPWRKAFGEMKANERSDPFNGSRLRLLKDTASDLHWEWDAWLVPNPPSEIKPWYLKHGTSHTVYRDTFAIFLHRQIVSGQPIGQNVSEGMDRFIENGKKLIDQRFPQ